MTDPCLTVKFLADGRIRLTGTCVGVLVAYLTRRKTLSLAAILKVGKKGETHTVVCMKGNHVDE